MIGAVQVKLLALELSSARDALAGTSMLPPEAVVQAEVILELSAEAQQLLKLPTY